MASEFELIMLVNNSCVSGCSKPVHLFAFVSILLLCMPVIRVIQGQIFCGYLWARGCRISPPRFLAECGRSPLNQGSFVVLYFVLFNFSGLYLVTVACHLSF